MVFRLNSVAVILALGASTAYSQEPILGGGGMESIAKPLPGVFIPPVLSGPSSDDDGISDKCGEKLKSMCDPTADAMTYDTCIAAKVCEADGFCTYQELLQFSNRVCSLVTVSVLAKCGPLCDNPQTQAQCNSCRTATFRQGGCANTFAVDAVVMRYLNKLNDGTCKAENTQAGDEDVDADKNGLTDDCEKIVRATCDPTKEANNYDECLSANACLFADACTPKELTLFSLQYCKLMETSAKTASCKNACSGGPKGKVDCGRCVLKTLIPAGCEYNNLLNQRLKVVDAVYNKLQMGDCQLM